MRMAQPSEKIRNCGTGPDAEDSGCTDASWLSLLRPTLSLLNAQRAVNELPAMAWSATTSHSIHALIRSSSLTSDVLSAATLKPVSPAACASASTDMKVASWRGGSTILLDP